MNQRLEQYLGEAEQKLQGLPEARRQEELEEMRQHLTASVEAHEELGLDTKSATEESIRQFGAARQVGSGLKQVWWREQVGGPRGLWKTAALAVALRFVMNGLLSPLVTAASLIYVQSSRGAVSAPDTGLLQAALVLLTALPSVAAGIVLARVSPRNAVIGAVVGGGVCFLIMLLNIALSFWAVSLSSSTGTVVGPWMVYGRDPLGILLMVGTTWLTARYERKRLALTQ